jgi:hypothetical protein
MKNYYLNDMLNFRVELGVIKKQNKWKNIVKRPKTKKNKNKN